MYSEFSLPVGLVSFADDDYLSDLNVKSLAHDETDEMGVFIPEIWAVRALGALRDNCVMTSLVVRDYENELATMGNTVNVQKRGALVTNDKDTHKAVTLQQPQADTVAVVLDNHKEVSFLVEDVGAAQANTDVIDGYIEDGAIAMGDTIDRSLLYHYLAAYNAGYTIDIGAAFDNTDALACRTALVIDGKSGGRPRYLVVRDLAELLIVDKFISSDYVDRHAIEEGAVGKIEGFQVFEDANVYQTTSPTQVRRLAFVRGGLVFVTRRLPDPPADLGVRSATIVEDNVALRVLYGYNMSFLGTQVTMDILFGSKILRPEWVYDVS